MNNRLHTITTIIALTLTGIVSQKTADAQSLDFGDGKLKVEAGINIGPSFFLGDLGGNRGTGTRFVKDVNLPLTKLMVGAFVAVHPNEWLGIRAAIQYGKLEGKDAVIDTKGRPELYRKQRNLDFRTNLFEAYVAAEIYPLSLIFGEESGYQPRLLPYGVIGVGMYHYNPQGSLTDVNGNKSWYYLKPLHLEGQGFDEYPDRKEYNLNQINIPMGVGVKYLVSEKVNISFEVLLRKSFNDYVDDVSTTYIDPALFDKYLSPQDALIARQIADKVDPIVNTNLTRNSPGVQRGNPNQNDSWFTTFIKLGINLGATHDKSQIKRLRCPVRF